MFNKLRAYNSERGVALIIVLALLVVLVGVVLAFFSRTLTDRMVSNADTGVVRADAIGRSGLAIVVSGLKQEIVITSSTTSVGSGSNTSTLYTPTSPVYMVPIRSGTTGLSPDPIPNMVSRSMRSDGIVIGTGTITSNASPVNSGSDVSLNGRSVSPATWNAHYLVPLSGTSGQAYDSTPISNFSPPDWVLVSRTGPVVSSTWNSNLANSNPGNTNFIVGRYAYAIYDEGGLLNVNVAGYPSSTGTTQSGYKGVAAYADLTQLSGTVNGTSWSLSGSSVDNLVGWRNYADIQPSGTFPSLNLSSAAGTYYTLVTSNTNGFMNLSGSVYNGTTDQAVMSRQQLIQLSESLGVPASALQYLGTFSRDLEQPTFVPNPARPTVQSSGGPPSGANAATFGTGNDAYLVDRYGATGQPAGNASQDINPPFLQVRVSGASFVRPDGSTANIGDPLITKRFPLSRLGLIVTGTTATQSQSDPIYRNFGLYRTSNTGPWLYNHGGPVTTAGTGILRLSDVAKLGREPDFFELLKAAINVGALAKSSCYDYSNTSSDWTTVGDSGYLMQAQETLTALQILRIGASIIDQAKADNFPTRIQFSGNSTYEVRGVEDLPYLYGFRNWITQYSPNLFAVLIQPELWNPHSYPGSSTVSGTALSGTATPSTFRVRIIRDPTSSNDPMSLIVNYYYIDPNPNPPDVNSGKRIDNTTTTGTYDASSFCTFNDPNYDPVAPNPQPLVFYAGEANNFWGFREPTLLGVSTMPASCHMGITAFTDVTTGTNMTGIVLAQSIPWVSPVTNGATDNPYKINIGVNSDNACLRAYLEYLAGSNWVTYDEQVFEYQRGASSLDMHTIGNYHTYPAAVAALDWMGGVRTDPRTSRWGFMYTEYFYTMPVLDVFNNEYTSFRPDAGISWGSHLGGKDDNGFVQANNYGKQYRGFQHGYWEENSVRSTYQTDTSGNPYRYNRDPDGVPRRAMGGYWSDTSNGGVTPSAATTPATGLPMATGTSNGNYSSRPTILHRPFQSVAELGYVFSDTPWHNLDLSFPESGYSALLDVFCINENSNTNGMVAGHVSLNTRQAPVLQALLAGTITDKDNSTVLSATQAAAIAAQLVARTSGTLPLVTRTDLVGTWSSAITTPAAAATALKTNSDPSAYYSGFSADIGKLSGVSGTPVSLIPRQREAVMRALADSGSTRTWNLLIDLVAQSGRYPPSASSLGSFVADGQQHYWLHVAIDRFTGKVIDSQLEIVKQ